MRIVIIGSGNTAETLGKLLQPHHQIVQIVGRNASAVKLLAKKLQCSYSISMQQIDRSADVYIIAVPDSVIPFVAKQLYMPHALVLHTSGTTSIQVLQKTSKTFGVIWPVQTLSKKNIPTPLPFAIHAVNKATLTTIKKIITPISSTISIANDEQRQKLHVAAVIANNFTNHLFALLLQFCKLENIDVQMLQPIVQATVDNFLKKKSLETQTGPAIRKDATTIKQHQQLLEIFPELLSLYKQLTRSIQKSYS